MKIERFEDEQSWLEFRKGKITGTTAAACLGLGKWQSQYSLWMQLTERTKIEFKVSEPMKWGKILEGPILEEYKSKLDYKPEIITEGGFWVLLSESFPWLMASPDLIHGGNEGIVVVDAKNTRDFPYLNEEMPIQYTIQLLLLMALANADKAVLAVLHNGQVYREYTLERNLELINNFLLKLDEWYHDFVVLDNEPDADGSDATKQALANATWFGEELVQISPDSELLLSEREELKEEEKEIKERLQEIENIVKAEIKGGKIAQGLQYQIKRSDIAEKEVAAFTRKASVRFNYKKMK
jgi:putative phage-type endonuclease